jgi:Tol biopolymer transport system component
MKNKYSHLINMFLLVCLLCGPVSIIVIIVSQLHGISFQGKIAIEGTISPQDSGIYLYDRVFHTLKRITSPNISAFSPIWSPDGTKLAFLSGNHNNTNLRLAVVDVSNESVEILLDKDGNNLSIDQETSLAWSPDGSQLLFDGNSTNSPDINSCRALYLYNFSKKESRQLNIQFCQSKTGNHVNRLDISWFPENTPLIGASYERAYFPKVDDIFIMDQTLKSINWIAQGSYPVWRPGTKDFSFICQNTWNPFPNSICLYSTSNAFVTKIVDNYSYDKYIWSPDGKNILFVDKGYHEGNMATLSLINIEDKKEYPLSYLFEIKQIGNFSWRAVSWLAGKVIWSSK